MSPLFVVELKEWNRPFQKPEKSKAGNQNKASVRRGNGFKVIYDRFHGLKIGKMESEKWRNRGTEELRN